MSTQGQIPPQRGQITNTDIYRKGGGIRRKHNQTNIRGVHDDYTLGTVHYATNYNSQSDDFKSTSGKKQEVI